MKNDFPIPKQVHEFADAYQKMYIQLGQCRSAYDILFKQLQQYKMITQEELARKMYDKYCESVGGLAFNGDKLPHSDEFFADESKLKQANAWRDAAAVALDSTGDPLPPDPTHPKP